MIAFLNFILLFAVFFDCIGAILSDPNINYLETNMYLDQESAIYSCDAFGHNSLMGWEHLERTDDGPYGFRNVFKPNRDFVSYLDIKGTFDVYYLKAKDGEIEIIGSEGDGFMYIGRNRPDTSFCVNYCPTLSWGSYGSRVSVRSDVVKNEFIVSGAGGHYEHEGYDIFHSEGGYFVRVGRPTPIDTTVLYANGVVDTVAMIEYIKSSL